MAENKTTPNDKSVKEFLDQIGDRKKRADCHAILDLMEQATGLKPRMWGDSIVGFGSYHYKYESGREGTFFLTGFSPRKQSLTIYIMAGFDRYPELMDKLGKYTTGKSCLYINCLDDIHIPTLKKLVKQSVDHMIKTHK